MKIESNIRTLIYVATMQGAAFRSQVVELLIEISERNFFKEILLFIGVKPHIELEEYIVELKKHKIKVIPYKKYPNYSFFDQFQKQAFIRILKKHLNRTSVIHIRGERHANCIKKSLINLNYLNIKILCDIRGAAYEENNIYANHNVIMRILKLKQLKNNIKHISGSANMISCVSKELKKYVISKSNMEDSKCSVNHCIAPRSFMFNEKIRNLYRRKLDILDDEILFVYSTGGNARWQKTDYILKSIIEQGFKVLNLSKCVLKDENVINLFVPFEEMPGYLCAADIGVVWRDNNTVNRVASPIKFSEYICTGLPIIANNSVKLISNYIKETKFGVVLNSYEEIDKQIVEFLLSFNRYKISKYAAKNYSSKTIIENYLNLYEQLLSKN